MKSSTIEIVKRFEQSWKETQKRYDTLIGNGGFNKLIPIKQFIKELQDKGESKHFRIGTSMYSLIISRSVDFGLRVDQKSIKIEAFNEGDFEILFKDGLKTHRKYRINTLDDERLFKLMQTLKDTLVD